MQESSRSLKELIKFEIRAECVRPLSTQVAGHGSEANQVATYLAS